MRFEHPDDAQTAIIVDQRARQLTDDLPIPTGTRLTNGGTVVGRNEADRSLQVQLGASTNRRSRSEVTIDFDHPATERALRIALTASLGATSVDFTESARHRSIQIDGARRVSATFDYPLPQAMLIAEMLERAERGEL